MAAHSNTRNSYVLIVSLRGIPSSARSAAAAEHRSAHLTMEGDDVPGGSRHSADEGWSSDGYKSSDSSSSSGGPSDSSSCDSSNDSRSSSSHSSSHSDRSSSYYSSDFDDDDENSSRGSYDNSHRGHIDFGSTFRDTFVSVMRHRRASRTPPLSSGSSGGRFPSNHDDDIRLRVFDANQSYDDPEDDDSPYHYSRRKRRSRSSADRDTTIFDKVGRIMRLIIQTMENYCPRFCGSRKATMILMTSILLWLFSQLRAELHEIFSSENGEYVSGDVQGQLPGGRLFSSLLARKRNDRSRQAQKALGSAAGEYKKKDQRRKNKKSGGNPDKLPEGCSYPNDSWVLSAYPNCNEIHEIDLRQGYNPRRKALHPSALAAAAEGGTAVGYVGSGLWRDVWKIDPRGETLSPDHDTIIPPAVLKVMKQEHPYDFRNYDRHRRDSMVMERLSSSQYVVDIYGYCANSVLSEYVGRTLDDLIYDDDEDKKGKERDDGDDSNSDGIHTLMESVPELTRKTPAGRIRLALDVFRGILDLHEINGGPIIHADLQAKQFLIDPLTKTVRINDFNRCRFLPRKNGDEDGEICPIRIPSAPGANRSPEEYNTVRLTEKIDVFSAGNILYGILTGGRHWATLNKRTIKKAVLDGKKPPIPDEFRIDPTDKALAELIDETYNPNPKKRISAKEMVEKLENLLVIASNSDDSKDSLRKR